LYCAVLRFSGLKFPVADGGERDAGGAAAMTDEEDEDVAQERRRVLRGSGRRDLLQLRNLSKVSYLLFCDDDDDEQNFLVAAAVTKTRAATNQTGIRLKPAVRPVVGPTQYVPAPCQW